MSKVNAGMLGHFGHLRGQRQSLEVQSTGNHLILVQLCMFIVWKNMVADLDIWPVHGEKFHGSKMTQFVQSLEAKLP